MIDMKINKSVVNRPGDKLDTSIVKSRTSASDRIIHADTAWTIANTADISKLIPENARQ